MKQKKKNNFVMMAAACLYAACASPTQSDLESQDRRMAPIVLNDGGSPVTPPPTSSPSATTDEDPKTTDVCETHICMAILTPGIIPNLPECQLHPDDGTLLSGKYAAQSPTIADLNGDDLPEVLIARQACGSDVWLNIDGVSFANVTASTGLALNHVSSFAVGDMDNDGDNDVVAGMFTLDGPSVRIFWNYGLMAFSEEPTTPDILPGPVNTLALTDLDEDGFLDILVSRPQWVDWNGLTPMPGNGLLMQDNGTFVDVARILSLNDEGHTWAILPWNVNKNEGTGVDLVVQNDRAVSEGPGHSHDGGPNHPHATAVYLQGEGFSFERRTDASYLGDQPTPMGATVCDLDGNGTEDLIFTAAPNDFLIELDGIGTDGVNWAVAAGVWGERGDRKELWGWTPLCADFNRDGRLDLFIANGTLQGEVGVTVPDGAFADLMEGQPDNLFLNNGNGTLTDTGPSFLASLDAPVNHQGRGAAMADLDGNGALDVCVGSWGPNETGVFCFRSDPNLSHEGSHGITVRPVAPRTSLVLGATVRVQSSEDDTEWSRVVNPFGGAYGHSDMIAHVGVGNETTVDVTVTFTDGSDVTVTSVHVDQSLVINYPN